MIASAHLRRRATIVLCVALLALSACGKKKGTEPPPPPPPAPIPSSPTALLELIEYCWDQRNVGEYRKVFTTDFQFCFVPGDLAGSDYPNCSWTRDDELATAQALFQTGLPGQGRAQTIELEFTNSPMVVPDPRPGKDPIWHRNIRTPVTLNVTTVDGGQYNIVGNANFFMTRGDSAQIPPGLGLTPDSTRWYVDRWEDESNLAPQPGTVRAQPTQKKTWGYLKVQYTPTP